MLVLLYFKCLLFFTWNVLVHSNESNPCYVASKQCPNENITYWLVRRDENMELDEVQLNFESPFMNWDKTKFNSTVLMKFLVHGFMANRFDDFNQEMIKELLNYDAFYIINVDWGPLAQGETCRAEASKNAQLVAQCTAEFIENLIENTEYPLEHIHVIGFSMGAQVAGLIHNYFTMDIQLHHITGLDPTLPYFEANQPQLRASSANFVDVIHTAIGVKSQIEPRGHVDFYMNNATYQPGCEQLDLISGREHICSHRRSYKYYAESINSKTGFYGRNVFSYGPNYVLMGFHVDFNVSGVYRVMTKSSSPYALDVTMCDRN